MPELKPETMPKKMRQMGIKPSIGASTAVELGPRNVYLYVMWRGRMNVRLWVIIVVVFRGSPSER